MRYTYALAAGALPPRPRSRRRRRRRRSDTVVMAKQIDDIITLDPAEAFEFSGVEVGANVYDQLIGVDRQGSQQARRRAGRELDGQRRRPDLHLQDPAGR